MPLSFIVPLTATLADTGVADAVGILTATLVLGVLALTAAGAAAAGGGDGCNCGCAGELAATGGSAGAGDMAAIMAIGL